MAPAPPARPAKDQRAKSILAFAEDLQSQLKAAAASKTSNTTSQELEKQLSSFPENLTISSSAKCEELDHCGTALWNLCTRLRRDYESDKPQDVPMVLLLARVYSFLMIDCAHGGGKSSGGNMARLMKTGLKAGKNCLDRKQLDLTFKVLMRISDYEVSIRKAEEGMESDERQSCERLVAEYYVLRTALCWRQEQFEVADYMYSKSMSAKQYFDPSTAESLADVLYEIGKEFLLKENHTMAIKWLDRASEVLDGQELDRLGMDAGELRISIIQSLTKALLGTKEPEAANRAYGLVNLLESQIGDKLVVLLLRLELLTAAGIETFNSTAYYDVLQQMMRTLPLTDSNFKLIMSHIRKLNDKSPSLACKALDNFLTLRIVYGERDEWFEKALVTRLWLASKQTEGIDAVVQLGNLFATLVANVTKPASPAATLAAHTLLWKRIESSYTQGQFDMAEKWCYLAMHELFANSGEINMARISRKLLLCALGRKDMGSAREIFSSMPEAAKNEPMSRFLMYKIAVRCGEAEIASECLHLISSASTKDSKLLYACVLDAQQVGNKNQTLAALQLVLEKSGYDDPSANLPSLLRLTIVLMVQILDESFKLQEGHGNGEASVEKLCAMYQKGVTAVKRSQAAKKEPDSVWTADELHWFSKNSYNLAIKHLADWEPSQSLQMLECCIEFMDRYPKDISKQLNDDLSLRRMFCDFTAATALVGLARAEDNIERQLQDYLRLRKHVESFDMQLQNKTGSLEEEAETDLRRKLTILAAFDFEAACRLKAWDELPEIILKADACKSSQVYEIMADIVLSCQPPPHVTVSALKKIVNEAWGMELLDIPKLSKYIRCLFQITFSDNIETAEQLLDQVHSYATDAAETDQPYPSEELEWMATKAFNHAVDFYCAGNDETSKIWSAKALNIAHHCADQGNLERVLQSKLLSMKFD